MTLWLISQLINLFEFSLTSEQFMNNQVMVSLAFILYTFRETIFLYPLLYPHLIISIQSFEVTAL